MASSNQQAAVKDDAFICSICLEVYHKPVTTGCGHTFCKACIQSCAQSDTPQCPVCRAPVSTKKKKRNYDIEGQMTSLRTRCKSCGIEMYYSNVRSHSSTCTGLQDVSDVKFSPVAETSHGIPSNVPNRSTFTCPFCGEQNLDSLSMVKHCNDNHTDDSTSVVCPICAAMPWGDPNLHSANFLSHLNVRHQFEYDTFVDYETDDDAMLQAALKASLQET